MNIFIKGEFSSFFIQLTKKQEELKLYIYKQGELKKLDCELKKINDFAYECKVKFDEIGRQYIEIHDKDDNFIGSGIIEVIEKDYLKAIYNAQFGNWEIKNNQLIMRDENDEEIARFNLFDSKGRPTMRNILKRIKVE